jgi:hypothetical protein
MAEEEKRLLHYRFGGKITHAGVECLPAGKDIIVTIERIAFVEKEIINGEQQTAWVAYLKPNPYTKLPIVLNATNKKRLAKLSGTPYLETVKDLTITLCQEMDKAIGGGRDWGLRISNIKPPQVAVVERKPLTLASPNYSQLCDWLRDKGTLAGLLSGYVPDEACLVELKKIKGE